jgi:PhnB protein
MAGKLDLYINYPGNCEEAFRFYAQHLGGRLAMMMKHRERQNPQLPAEWADKVLHAQLELDAGAVLMGADIPNAEPMRSAYASLTLDSVEEAERVYALLSEGGQIFMKMEATFFSPRFAMLRDRFGTSWMLLAKQAGA